MGVEILVSNVAAAGDAQLVVGDENLVVHAAVEADVFAQRLPAFHEKIGAAGVEGIEQPHLDVGVGIRGGEPKLLVGGVDVVDQQAHAHPAFGGGQQRSGDQLAGGVVVEQVILHVQRAGGALRQREPGSKRGMAAVEQMETGFAGWDVFRQLCFQQAVGMIGGGMRGRAFGVEPGA